MYLKYKLSVRLLTLWILLVMPSLYSWGFDYKDYYCRGMVPLNQMDVTVNNSVKVFYDNNTFWKDDLQNILSTASPKNILIPGSSNQSQAPHYKIVEYEGNEDDWFSNWVPSTGPGEDLPDANIYYGYYPGLLTIDITFSSNLSTFY